MTYEVVERPDSLRGNDNAPDSFISALAETVTNGKAVKITLETGTNFINWQSKIRNRLRRMDPPLRMRCKMNKANKEVTAFAEVIQEDNSSAQLP